MKFGYKKFGDSIFRPVMPVEVSFNGIPINYEVLVDSGADNCVFDRGIGEIIGIIIESGILRATTGISGHSVKTYRHTVTLGVGGWEHTADVDFADLGSLGHGVVGQIGFFNQFKVKFDYQKKEIELVRKS